MMTVTQVNSQVIWCWSLQRGQQFRKELSIQRCYQHGQVQIPLVQNLFSDSDWYKVLQRNLQEPCGKLISQSRTLGLSLVSNTYRLASALTYKAKLSKNVFIIQKWVVLMRYKNTS